MISSRIRNIRVFESRFDHLLERNPVIGRVFAFFMGLIEVAMLDTFRFIKFITGVEMLKYVDQYITKGRWGGHVIPLNVNISAETKFLPTQEILEIVSRSKVLGIGQCYCRTTYKNCSNPTSTCIHLGRGRSLYDIPNKSENLRRVSKEEVIKLLEECDNLGLIHELIYFPNPEFYYVICNCCPCCCIPLGNFLKSGSPQVVKSDFVAVTDLNKCTDCSTCEKWCYFGARKMINKKLIFDPVVCFGCGLCVSKCPQNAITLKKKR